MIAPSWQVLFYTLNPLLIKAITPSAYFVDVNL